MKGYFTAVLRLIAFACAVTGCVEASGNNATDMAHVVVTWTLNSAATNTVAMCPAGFDTVALYSQQIDSMYDEIGTPTIDLFDCTAGTGTSVGLAPATYNEWIEVTSHDLTQQFAKSASSLDQNQVVDLTTVDVAVTAEVLVDGGYFLLGWQPTGATSMEPLTCTEANVTGGISVTISDATGDTYNDIFPTCTVLSGLTRGVPSGNYTVSVKALDAMSQTLGMAADSDNEVISAPSLLHPVTTIGIVTIPITGL